MMAAGYFQMHRKSSLANTLLGDAVFEAKRSLGGVTIECCKGQRTFQGIELIVVDTPGLFNADRSEDELSAAIASCTQAVLPGPHAFLLVLSCNSRFTVEDRNAINWVTNRFGKDHFGKDALDYSVVVFTHIDALDEGEKLEDFLPQSKDSPIRQIISACGSRVYGVNNREKQETIRTQYVNDLIRIINSLIAKNQGREYVPPLMSDIAQIVQKRYKESHGQFKFIDPNGIIIPLPEAIRAVNEFYRLQQQQRDRQDRVEQRRDQRDQQQDQQDPAEQQLDQQDQQDPAEQQRDQRDQRQD